MATPRPPSDTGPSLIDLVLFDGDSDKSSTTTVGSSSIASITVQSQNRTTSSGDFLHDLGTLESILLIVCATTFVVLLLSLAYFYAMIRLGRFSDNPWYRRRMYYQMKRHTTTHNPARSFNVLQRERPNTLSLSGALPTPTTVLVAVPTMDACVGDDEKLRKSLKSYPKGTGGKKHQHHHGDQNHKPHHHQHNVTSGQMMMNSLAPPISSASVSKSPSRVSKVSTKVSEKPPKEKSHHSSKRRGGEAVASSDEESGAYVTPPQDNLMMTSEGKSRKEKEKHRSHKK